MDEGDFLRHPLCLAHTVFGRRARGPIPRLEPPLTLIPPDDRGREGDGGDDANDPYLDDLIPMGARLTRPKLRVHEAFFGCLVSVGAVGKQRNVGEGVPERPDG